MAWLSYRLKPACSSTGTRPNGWQARCSGYFHERAPRGAATQPQGPTRLSLSTKISKTTPCKVAWWSLAWMLGAIPRNILTRRANQRHYSIIAQFEKRPWPCPTMGSSARLQAKNPFGLPLGVDLPDHHQAMRRLPQGDGGNAGLCAVFRYFQPASAQPRLHQNLRNRFFADAVVERPPA